MEVFQLNAPNPNDLPPSKRSKKEKDDKPEPDVRVSAGGVRKSGMWLTCAAQTSAQPLDYTPRGAPRPSIDNIVKGVTATKLFDLYNATDLRDYCKYALTKRCAKV